MVNRSLATGVIALAGLALFSSFLPIGAAVRPASAQIFNIPPIHIKSDGPSAMEFNLYGLNSWDRTILSTRSRGMGGVFLALPGEAASGTLNPASLATIPAPLLSSQSRSRGGAASGTRIPPTITGDDGTIIEVSQYRPSVSGTYTYDNLAYGMPLLLADRRAGVSLSYHRMIDFRSGEETRMKVKAALGEADLGQGFEFHGGVDAISPALGIHLNDNLSVGATLNFMSGHIKENGNQGVTTFGFVVSRGSLLFEQDVSGTSLDLGANYKLGPRLTLGAVLQPGHNLSFRHGFYSYQPLSTQQTSTPILFVFERTLLDHTLSVPTMFGLGGTYEMMNGRLLLGADYWHRPWSKAEYERRDYDVLTIFPDSTSLTTNTAIYRFKDNKIKKSANLIDTSHIRLGAEYLVKQGFGGGTRIPIRLGFRREPLTLANANPDSFMALVAATRAISGNTTLSVSQRKALISSILSDLLQDGPGLIATDKSITGTTFSLGSGIAVGSFSLDVAYSRTSYTADRLFLGSFSDLTIAPRPQRVTEKHTVTELSIATTLRF